ncbi:putative sterigmatocystin biosynthesis P450 monooxygenase [Lasiodiplodia theobromae]|uniref:Putative sterigmatocystin biosynthesis P450 monooxygenase n=1 Tax=Lasiodiplodia theobromae TaxID=45133 RepID=A0A5N5CXG0_9PEZI|nr:putative sterigmatocystin biosynthesis P450 monooxygenase [Lasiodiplodia theobromae]
MVPFMKKFLTDASMYHAVTELALSLEKEAFYLDLWPLSEPLLILTTPAMTSQLTQEFNPPKPSVIKKALARLTGDPDLFTMSDIMSKQWRAILNPDFSPNYMLQQTPKIVDECRVFCEKMRARACENQIFSPEEDAIRLSLDVIGIVTLDTHFKYQQSTSWVTESLRKLIKYTSSSTELSLSKRWNPIRIYNLWHHGRKINRYIEAELDKRFLKLQHSHNPKHATKTAKPLITLALDAYLAEQKTNTASLYSPYLATLDPTFKRSARTHLRHLLLTPTTTTASTTIAHTLHLLSTHPSSLARLRAEHNRVFGTNTSAAPDRVGALLAAVPGLLNHLPYTTACVNEALRLSAAGPAFGPRVGGQKGEKNVVLVGSDGTRYPTAGCKVVPLYRDGRRDPAALMHPDVFMPERWIPPAATTTGPGNALRVAEGGWRPVEGGGRDGMGQAVVVAEVKILLAMWQILLYIMWNFTIF